MKEKGRKKFFNRRIQNSGKVSKKNVNGHPETSTQGADQEIETKSTETVDVTLSDKLEQTLKALLLASAKTALEKLQLHLEAQSTTSQDVNQSEIENIDSESVMKDKKVKDFLIHLEAQSKTSQEI